MGEKSDSDKSNEMFTFGVIADVQYADSDDGYNYEKTFKRYYRNALQLCERAYSEFETTKCAFALQLGDIIDGRCGRQGYSVRALESVMQVLNAHSSIPTVHVWGNHDLVCFQRSALFESALRPPDETVQTIGPSEAVEYDRPSNAAYYAFTHKNVRFVALDTYEISVHGYPKEHERYQLAESLIREHNKHASHDWNHAKGLPRELKRYVAYNGGLTDAQLDWLSAQCRAAAARGHRLVLYSHTPLNDRAHPPHRQSLADSICWQSEAVRSIVKRDYVVPTRRNVLIFSGHTHHYGHYFEAVPKELFADDQSNSASNSVGIYHVVLPGIIECPPERGASHWIVNVYPNHIELHGSQPHVCSFSVRV